MKSKMTLFSILSIFSSVSAFAGECRYEVWPQREPGGIGRIGEQSRLTVEQCVTEALAETAIYEADHPNVKPTTTITHSDLGAKKIYIE